jgi:hypothetical protein
MGEDQIDLIGDQTGDQIIRRTDADIEAYVGMRRLKLRDRRRQKLARDRFDRGDADLAAYQAAQLFDLRLDRLELGNRLPCIGEKDLAGCGQPHAARQPLEKIAAQIEFEIEDLPVQCGGRDVERFGRLADRAVARHGVDIGQKAWRPQPFARRLGAARGNRRC